MMEGLLVGVLPRPAMLHFEMQSEAEEGTDENNQAKHDDTVEAGIDDNRVDDVARDKEFKSQQNGTTHILSTKTICPNRGASSRGQEKSNRCDGRSNDHDGDTSDLYRGANNFYDLSES